MINLATMFETGKEVMVYITPAFVALVLWRLNAVERSVRELRTMFIEFLKDK